jgi:hypothetical protein
LLRWICGETKLNLWLFLFAAIRTCWHKIAEVKLSNRGMGLP